ncbi:Hypp9422 [Branchiostoma lanceolatum]|uniref:Hypp9422 protein n=1 Tax=Branchiostoma lanceolatum TaxID=7740 RepID=A0A8S4MMA9_BRALA|nr:Hypp9422 [Branchiostoma lanceolatum]
MALDAECHAVVGSDDELAMRKAIGQLSARVLVLAAPDTCATALQTICVTRQYTELERCLQGVGDYLLCQDFQWFRVHEVAWMRMTNEERERHFSQFMRHKTPGIPQSVTSTDGTRVITKRTNGGKKPGQVKRKRATRTTTLKRTKT